MPFALGIKFERWLWSLEQKRTRTNLEIRISIAITVVSTISVVNKLVIVCSIVVIMSAAEQGEEVDPFGINLHLLHDYIKDHGAEPTRLEYGRI